MTGRFEGAGSDRSVLAVKSISEVHLFWSEVITDFLDHIGVLLDRLVSQAQLKVVPRKNNAEPAGPWVLMELTHICMCGAPFDIEISPVFRARAEEAGIAWPPASPIHFPAKTY